MKKLLLFLTSLLLTASICNGKEACTNGKVYNTCGTMCPLTCDNKDNPPLICPLACMIGCACPSGMVEYNDGCVAPADCPTTVCTNGSVYTSCGSSCPLTCDNKDNPPSCIQGCVEGCFCPDGMYATGGACVLSEDCPGTSAPNYGNPYVTPPISCPDSNESLFGACVITSDCVDVGIGGNGNCNEGSLCCETGCGGLLCNEGVHPSPLCSAVQAKVTNESNGLLGAYIPQCEEDGSFSSPQCHEGMCWCVDVETGKALNESVGPGTPLQCTYTKPKPVCTDGSVYTSCGSNCPLTCDNKDNPPSCIQECVEGCFCPNGMYAAGGACVLSEDCPNTCTNGKVYNTCGTMCPLTCDNKDDGPVPCPLACKIGCTCPSGMVEYNDGCVAPADCPTTVSKPADCLLPPVGGLCKAYNPKYFYNSTTNKCEEFIYGGCGGNDNKFDTKDSCMESCGDAVSVTDPPTTACTNGKVFTGCGTMCPLTCDNKDNPPLICPLACKIGCTCPSGMVEYNDGCVAPVDCPTTVSKPADCLLPPVGGLCEAYFPKFFYNSTTNKCEEFIYGGCGGNDNKFDTKDSCMESCGDAVSVTDPPITVLVAEAIYNAQHVCPVPTGDDDELCGNHCTTDESCEDWEKCCSNGCGYSCMESVAVPYYSPPLQCPQPILPICNFHFACSSHDNCTDDGNYCCSTGCGAMCMTGIEPEPLCSTVRDSAQSSGMLGAYIPDCDEKGNFSSLQCHGSTGMCWCVDVKNGKPITAPVFAQQPDCDNTVVDKCKGIQCDWPYCGEDIQPLMDDKHCCPYCPETSCKVGDEVYESGTSFKSPDGCNTCNCINGLAACTEMACLSTCKFGDTVMYDGETRSDGCSECICEGSQISCALSEDGCTDPILRSVDVTMKFNGDFDVVSQDLEGFKTFFKSHLVTKYQSMKLHESQITNLDIYRGSIVVVATLEDDTEDDVANITLLLMHLQQDYSNNQLVIEYGDVVLEPADDFSYEDNNDNDDDFFFGTHIIISGILIVLVAVLIITVIGVFIVMKKSRKITRVRIPSKDLEDYELNGEMVKGFSNPITTQAI